MKYWEFLIQKEGDDTWLPLETHQVEILTGRYRVAAHTDRTNTPVDIRVSQLVTTEVPPRKRVRSRTSQTNSAGLVVVIPYMQLEPGQWDLTCSGQNITAGMDDWQYTVQLQVFGAAEENGAAELSPLADSVSDASNSGNQSESSVLANPDLPLVQAQKHSRARLQNSLRSLLPGASDTEGLNTGERGKARGTAYGIALERQVFLAHSDRPMVIVGQVQALADLAAVGAREGSQLWLRLQNPETNQAIMEAHRPINLDRLPADFKVKIQLPAQVTTQIVWGEVSLRSASHSDNSESLDAETPNAVLSFAAFAITTGISRLLDDVANGEDANGFSEFEADSSAFATASLTTSLNGTARSVSPAVGVFSPPQLDQTVEVASSHSQISLPSFPSANPLIVSDPPSARSHQETTPLHQEAARSHLEESPAVNKSSAVNLPPMVAKPAQFMGTSIEDDDLETAQIAALLEDIDDDLGPTVPVSDSFSSPRDRLFSSAEPKPSAQPDNAEPDSTELNNPYHKQKQKQAIAKAAFRSLKLKDHFMQRLSSLTHDEVNQANKFSEDLQAAGVISEGPQAFTQADALANSEVVIFDEPSPVDEAVLAEPPSPQPPSPQPSLPSPPVQRALPVTSIPATSIPVPAEVVPVEPVASISTPVEPAPVPMPAEPVPAEPVSYGQSNGLLSQPLSKPAIDLPSTSSEADRNRQLRLARLRQRQAKARAAHSSQQPESSLPAAAPVSPTPAAVPTGALALHRGSEQRIEEFPEMVLPIISVPMGDLVAGDLVTITVRTRPSVFKPFIKLWMIDRQSRTVVGEPKLLSDLRPDALGDLQTSTELLVPMGCLDVQIAAIAIDIATQQESNKAIVNRHVIPPMQSLPPLRSVRRSVGEREW